MRFHILRTLCFLFIASASFSQKFEPQINPQDPSIPNWAKEMYLENPNVLEVDRLFKAYYKEHPFKQNNYTRYYKRWRRYVSQFLNDDGTIYFPSADERLSMANSSQNLQSQRSNTWSFLGPIVHRAGKYATTDSNAKISEHSNVYCIDRSMTNPNVLFCGTECGGVYKTTDQGQNWQYVTGNQVIEDVSAISIDPSNENTIVFSAANDIWRSYDGGQTWAIAGNAAFQALNVSVYQFNFNPINPQIIFAATNIGLYRSSDNGQNWAQVFSGESMSVEFMPGNPQIVYALQYNSVSKVAEFFKSTDLGLTFQVKPNGWFTVPAADAGLVETRGGRIAVTQANPNRVYVLLVGSSQSNATLQLRGTIGVYSSADVGENWTFPHNQLGMPYDLATHPNLMDFDGFSSNYSQIYYNTAFACSQLNEQNLLIGGLNLWRSNDGGASYLPVGGYVGGLPLMHVDLQEFKVYKTSPTTEEFWFSSDGGINYSTDWCTSHESRTSGVYASNFWGLDQGWNDDIIVGGRYHNGNAAYSATFDTGLFLAIGGGEAATGYINYSPERKTYFSDIGGRKIPVLQDQNVGSFSMSLSPNESYYDNASSRILFDWNYWNVAYMGKENVLYKSTDGGSSFGPLFTFGNNTASSVYWIEQSHADPLVFYVQQVVSNISKLWKTTDGGITFVEVALPQNRRELYFSLSHTNAQELWLGYTAGTNGNKVYTSQNGGQTWSNLTSATLNGLSIKSIAHQAGTNGGVYIATRNNAVYYRSLNLTDWQAVGSGLPASMYPLRLMPFYQKNKLRLGTWQLGIWETDLVESSSVVPDFSADFKTFTCPGDTVWFVNHSVCDSSATLLWSFPGANPATSSELAPKVTYAQSGTFEVTLTVSQNGQSYSITKTQFIAAALPGSIPLVEEFEVGSLPADWKYMDLGNDGNNWVVSDLASSYSQGNSCALFDNYYIDAGGSRDRILTKKLDFSNADGVMVSFDVAYSQYADNYSDTLAVLVSTDCAQSFSESYVKGGDELATAPDFTADRFVPTASQWRRDSVILWNVNGLSDVIIAFENRGRFGQALYIDKINIRSLNVSQIPMVNDVKLDVFPNPASDQITYVLKGNASGYSQAEIMDAQGKICLLFECNASEKQVNIQVLPAGVYFIRIKGKNGMLQTRFVKQ